jgi:hypothetical protein
LPFEEMVFREMRVLIAKPENDLPATDQSHPGRPSVSQISAETSSRLRSLSIEECGTYRNWRRALLAGYGLIAIFTVIALIGIGPPKQTVVKNNPAYSAISSRGKN